MKKRIVSFILVFVMLALTLTGCGYNMAKDDMSQYATFNASKFADLMANIEIKDGDFTTDEAVREQKVLDAIYAELVKAADGDALKEGKVGANDIVSYCYYAIGTLVDEKDDTKKTEVFVSNMVSGKPEKVEIGYSDEKLSDLQTAIKDAVLALEDVSEYVYSATTVEEGMTAYISYTVAPTDAEDKVTHSYVKVILGKDDAAIEANGEHQYVVEKLLSENATVGTKIKDFDKTVEGEKDEEGNVEVTTLAKYTGAVVNVAYAEEDKALLNAKEIVLTESLKGVDGEGNTKTLEEGATVTYYVYLVSYQDVEELTNESVVGTLLGSSISVDSLDCLKEQKDLIDAYKKAYAEKEEAQAAYDKAETDKAESESSDSEETEDDTKEESDELKALNEAKEAYDKALAALVAAVKTSDDENILVTEYKKSEYDHLLDDYNAEIRKNIANVVYEALGSEEYIKVTSYPEKLVKELYNRMYSDYENTFYTDEGSEDEESLYNQYNGNFKDYLAKETNTQGKNHQAAKDVLWARAQEKSEILVAIYTVCGEYELIDHDDIKEYKKTQTYATISDEKTGLGETLALAAYQFDTLMDYFLEVETEGEGDEEEPLKDEKGMHKYINISYTFVVEDEAEEE